MNAVTEFVKALGPARLAAMGAVAAGLIGFFIFLMMRLSQPQMAVLFTDLAFEDSIAVVKKLEGMNVPYQIRQDGAIILAPKEQVLKLRMQLAEDRLPAGGVVGYEIFDKSDSLGATSFVQNINHLRAIEGELARTIRALDRVQMARVHLVLPQRQLFSRKTDEPSASIVVKVRGNLNAGQIRSIQHLVASAVQGLKPGKVSIVDETGKLLASGRGDRGHGLSASGSDERNRAFENQMQQEIEEIVSRVVGPGRVRARVMAELDYNKITETSDIYDPDGQVVRSTQTRNESSSSTQPTGDNSVTVGNELPATQTIDGKSNSQKDNANKNEEIVNYEISRTTKTQVIEAGRIKRISIAVLVDGTYSKGADGKPEYKARSQAELDQITQLVRSAIGFDKERGDQVHVSNLRFAKIEAPGLGETEEASFFEFTKDDYFHIAELIVTLIVSLLVLLFVVRPLIRRIVTPEEVENEQLALEAPEAIDGEQAVPQLTGPDGQQVTPIENASQEVDANPNQAVKFLESTKVTGEVHASFIREVGEIVQSNTEEATSILREWIHSDSKAA